MHILIVLTQTVSCITETYETVMGLIENGIQVSVILSKNIENYNDWIKLKDKIANIYWIDTHTSKKDLLLKTINFFRNKKSIFDKINESKFDFVIDTMVNYWDLFILNGIRSGKKIVYVHDPIAHSGANKFKQKWWEVQYKNAEQLIVHTEKFIPIVAQLYGKTINNIHYIPLVRFSGHHNNWIKSDMGLNYQKEWNFLFFGYISKYKGIEVLGDAFKKLLEKGYSNVTLTIAGSGDFSPYEKQYSELNNVNIINRRILDQEVGNLFSLKNVINVLPYIDATQSGVIATALDFEVPVIASDTGGLKEQLNHGKIGIFCTAGDSISLCNAMEKFISNKEEYTFQKELIKEFLENIDRKTIAKELVHAISK